MWIKICGVNDPGIAKEIASLRPDAVGINFYERSVRFVSTDTARKITDALPPEIDAIGVFVRTSDEEMARVAAACRLDGVQFSPQQQGSCPALEGFSSRAPGKLLRRLGVFSVGRRGLAPLTELLDCSKTNDRPFDACLLDAEVEGEYGGTGRLAPWDAIRTNYLRDCWPRLILAGGLTPDNVAEAIETVRPWGVDVASGVESSRGVKDVNLVARFIEAARRAFERWPAATGAGAL